jgi:hypothetical protein
MRDYQRLYIGGEWIARRFRAGIVWVRYLN